MGRHHDVAVCGGALRRRRVGDARPRRARRPIAEADRVVICAVEPDRVDRAGAGRARRPRRRCEARRDDVVAVSPDHRRRGGEGPGRPAPHRARPRGVGGRGGPHLRRASCGTLVIDEADADLAGAVEAEGVRCVVAPTIMTGPDESAALAEGDAGVSGHRAHPRPRHPRGRSRATTSPTSSSPPPPATPRCGTATCSSSPRRSCPRPRAASRPSIPTTRLSHKAIVEREAVRDPAQRGDLMITETKHGFVCANAGIDLSNMEPRLGRPAPRRRRPLGPHGSATASRRARPA